MHKTGRTWLGWQKLHRGLCGVLSHTWTQYTAAGFKGRLVVQPPTQDTNILCVFPQKRGTGTSKPRQTETQLLPQSCEIRHPISSHTPIPTHRLSIKPLQTDRHSHCAAPCTISICAICSCTFKTPDLHFTLIFIVMYLLKYILDVPFLYYVQFLYYVSYYVPCTVTIKILDSLKSNMGSQHLQTSSFCFFSRSGRIGNDCLY